MTRSLSLGLQMCWSGHWIRLVSSCDMPRSLWFSLEFDVAVLCPKADVARDLIHTFDRIRPVYLMKVSLLDS